MAGYVVADKFEVPPENVASSDAAVKTNEIAPSHRWVPVQYAKGAPFSMTPDKNDGVVYMDEFVHQLVQTYGAANTATGIKGYSLDNEPALWDDSHDRMRTTPVGHTELITESIALAHAVKDVDPYAETFGPALFGFWAYIGFDDSDPETDSQSPNQVYDWYIDKYLDYMAQEEVSSGRRVLDVLDVHWYPEATGGGVRVWNNGPGAGSVDTQIARMQAPRTLWDFSYLEQGPVAQNFPQHMPILPRLQHSIDTYYPDTKLAITEYNYGATDHVSGGIAQADVLGIFGRKGIYMANNWTPLTNDPAETAYLTAGFKLYRNYNGTFGEFGDISVKSHTSDAEMSSIHASEDNYGDLHIIVINKDMSSPINGVFDIISNNDYNFSEVWGFDDASPDVLARAAIADLTNNQFTYTIPPLSAYHFVLSGEVRPTDTPTPLPTAVPGFYGDAYVSFDSDGTVGGVAYGAEDVLLYSTTTGQWSVYFDGSANGIDPNANVDALQFYQGRLLISFDSATQFMQGATPRTAEPEDLVLWRPWDGGMTWAFDGSDVGLDTVGEGIDAITIRKGQGWLSFTGAFDAQGQVGDGADFLTILTAGGGNTSGSWAMGADLSDIGLDSAGENVDAAWNDLGSNEFYFSTSGSYNAGSAAGGAEDIVKCTALTDGAVADCSDLVVVWSAPADVDGLFFSLQPSPTPTLTPIPTSTSTPTPAPSCTVTYTWNSWGSGFGMNEITVTGLSNPDTVEIEFTGTITSAAGWNGGSFTATGNVVTITGLQNGTTGFNGSSNDESVVDVTVDGVTCAIN